MNNSTLGDDLKFGSWGKGILAAIVSLISIVVIPLALIHFAEGLIDTIGGGAGAGDLFEGIRDMVFRFAIYGLPVVLLAFFTKSYDKGSKAKLLFTLMTLGYSIIWIFIIFEGGNMAVSVDLSSMFEDEQISFGMVDVLLSLKTIVMIMILLILFRMLLTFTSYGSNREKYLIKFNEKRVDKEYVPGITTTFGEDLKQGSFGRGLFSVFVRGVLIILIPYLIINYSEVIIETVGMSPDAEDIFDVILGLLHKFLIFGIPFVFLGFFTKFYEEGNKAGLVFEMISRVYSIIWILLIFDMGKFVLPFETGVFLEIGDYALGGNEVLWSIVIIIVLYILLKTVITLLAHRSKRRRYLRKLEESHGNKHRN